MRALFAAVIITLGLAAATPARAADLVEPGPAGEIEAGQMHYAGGSFDGVRAGEVLIYDDQPGVIRRAWWLAPWRHRHYFPARGERPVLGRLEDLSARSEVHPAKTFYRSWSNVALFVPPPPPPVRARARALDDEGMPRRPRTPVQP